MDIDMFPIRNMLIARTLSILFSSAYLAESLPSITVAF